MRIAAGVMAAIVDGKMRSCVEGIVEEVESNDGRHLSTGSSISDTVVSESHHEIRDGLPAMYAL